MTDTLRQRGQLTDPDDLGHLTLVEEHRASAWREKWGGMTVFVHPKPTRANEAGPRRLPEVECYDHRSIAWRRWIRREHSDEL